MFYEKTGLSENNIVEEQLKSLTMGIVDKVKCNEMYQELGGVSSGQICAAYPTGLKDFCDGDSGGPLVVNKRLAGIVSRNGPYCALPEYPGVYMEVAHYRSWIEKNIDEELSQ